MRRRYRFLHSELNATELFFVGIFCLPSFVFHTNLLLKIGQVVGFAFLATAVGKRIKIGYFLVMVLSITMFSLLNPFGRLLFSVGAFRVTSGALRQGLLRSLTIVGFVFISLFSIRRDLVLPGKVGGLLGRVLVYFERVVDLRPKIQPKQFIRGIDDVLEQLYLPGQQVAVDAQLPVKTTAGGRAIAILIVGINVTLLLLSRRFVDIPL